MESSYDGSNIYWDLDGVLRGLSLAITGKHPDKYIETIAGMEFCDYVDKHIGILEKAVECEYIELAKKFEPLQILSAQRRNWRLHTDRWIWKHLPQACPHITYVNKPEEKLAYLNGYILIEDYPFYKDYSKMIIVDRPYNRGVEADRAVNQKTLLAHIERRMGWETRKQIVEN